MAENTGTVNIFDDIDDNLNNVMLIPGANHNKNEESLEDRQKPMPIEELAAKMENRTSAIFEKAGLNNYNYDSDSEDSRSEGLIFNKNKTASSIVTNIKNPALLKLTKLVGLSTQELNSDNIDLPQSEEASSSSLSNGSDNDEDDSSSSCGSDCSKSHSYSYTSSNNNSMSRKSKKRKRTSHKDVANNGLESISNKNSNDNRSHHSKGSSHSKPLSSNGAVVINGPNSKRRKISSNTDNDSDPHEFDDNNNDGIGTRKLNPVHDLDRNNIGADTDNSCVACFYADYDISEDCAKSFLQLMTYFQQEYGNKDDIVLCQELAVTYSLSVYKEAKKHGFPMPKMPAEKWYNHMKYHILDPQVWIGTTIRKLKTIADKISDNIILEDGVGSEAVDGVALKHYLEVINTIKNFYNLKPKNMIFCDTRKQYNLDQKGQFINTNMRFKNR